LTSLVVRPPPAVTQQLTNQDSGVPTPPNSSNSFPLNATAVAHGTVTVVWSSSAPVTAQLDDACLAPGYNCAEQLHSWPSASSSGRFSVSGPLSFYYVLSWHTAAHEWANVTIAFTVTWEVPAPVPAGQVFAEVASGLLAVVGALGLFLGLFLRGDFRRPPRAVSRSADDAEAIAGATDPRTGPSDGGSGRPPPGPPARSR
jgi:hypothetical protein